MVHFYLHRFSQLNDSCFLKESDWLVYRIDWTFGIILYLWNNTNPLIVRIHTNKSAPFSHWLNITAEVALGPKILEVPSPQTHVPLRWKNSHVTNFRWNHRSYIHRGPTKQWIKRCVVPLLSVVGVGRVGRGNLSRRGNLSIWKKNVIYRKTIRATILGIMGKWSPLKRHSYRLYLSFQKYALCTQR